MDMQTIKERAGQIFDGGLKTATAKAMYDAQHEIRGIRHIVAWDRPDNPEVYDWLTSKMELCHKVAEALNTAARRN